MYIMTCVSWSCNSVFSNYTPQINSSPLKNDGWKTSLSFGKAYFQGRTVKFRECDNLVLYNYCICPSGLAQGGQLCPHLYEIPLPPRGLRLWSAATIATVFLGVDFGDQQNNKGVVYITYM